MSEYMKEAKRLAHAYADAKLVRYGMNSIDPLSANPEQAFAELLAHLQRGAVPGKQRDTAAKEYTAILAAAPAPDHFSDAKKMVAAPAEIPMPEPVGWYVSGSDPGHAALWLDRPDDEQIQVMNQQCEDGPVTAQPLVLGADAKRYGDAREAAGYARGREEAGRDADRYSFLRGDGGPTSVRWPRWEVAHWTGNWNPVSGKELDAAIDAALRGEVKP